MLSTFTNLTKILVVGAASSVFALQLINPGQASASVGQDFLANSVSISSGKLELSSFSSNVGENDSREGIVSQPQVNDQPFVIAKPINETFDDAFYYNSESTLDNWGVLGQLNFIFGWQNFEGSFPENQIYRDAELVNIVHRDAMRQQNQSDPTIRTRDLNNPFDTSVQQNPGYISPSSSSGTNDYF
ncbi:MAG: hypothetical protein AB4038_02680 [Prochloraceae cyanobacterium]